VLVRVELGKFACSGIEAQLGSDIRAGVRLALSHYALRLQSGRTPTPFPRYVKGLDRSAQAAYEVDLDPDDHATLEREASQRGTTTDELASHAVMTFLADMDMARPAA
jgi:hypothetical protein